MIDMLRSQILLHRNFGIECPESPKMLDAPHMKMRLNFMLEELCELANAAGFTAALTDNYEITFVDDKSGEFDPELILDALVDLQVVLLGTAQLLGFLNKAKKMQRPNLDGSYTIMENDFGLSVFEEAYSRVWQANMKKVKCLSAAESKRGFAIDLKKPEGWEPPNHSDLVEGMIPSTEKEEE